MVPFYGQGMNAGLEDVFVLFSILDSHSSPSSSSSQQLSLTPEARAKALAAYSAYREPDAHAINDLALSNYTEMRASVISPLYKARKYLEEHLSIWLPGLGWRTKYSRVSFGNERYGEVVRSDDGQGRLLMGLLGIAGAGGMVGLVGVVAWVARVGFGVGRRGGGVLDVGRIREVFGWLSG